MREVTLDQARARMHALLAHARGVQGKLPPDEMLTTARSIQNLTVQFAGVAPDDERTCLREGARIARDLMRAGHPEARELLIITLRNLGESLKDVPSGSPGIRHAQQLVATWRELAELGEPPDAPSNLGNSLGTLALRHQQADDMPNAILVATEGLAIWRSIRKGAIPADIRAMHLAALMNQYNRLAEAGRDGELEAVAREAVQVADDLDGEPFADPGRKAMVKEIGTQFRAMFQPAKRRSWLPWR